MMFDGLRSPWMTPRACACASPASTWSTIDQTTLQGRCVVCIHSWTLRPGRTSMTKNGRAVGELSEVARAHDGGVIEQRDGARLLVEPPVLLGPRLALLGRRAGA